MGWREGDGEGIWGEKWGIWVNKGDKRGGHEEGGDGAKRGRGLREGAGSKGGGGAWGLRMEGAMAGSTLAPPTGSPAHLTVSQRQPIDARRRLGLPEEIVQ